jgi:predicted metallo-beta-lactamase superfamily hydrolase
MPLGLLSYDVQRKKATARHKNISKNRAGNAALLVIDHHLTATVVYIDHGTGNSHVANFHPGGRAENNQ